MIVGLNNASDVFIQFLLPFVFNKTLPVLNSKNCLNMDLYIGVCHINIFICRT